MVPRADIIVGLELDTDVKDILKIFSESNHSRIPVYRETLGSHWNVTYEGSYKCFFR